MSNVSLWTVQFRSCSKLDGPREYFVREKAGDTTPAVFRTREEAREFAHRKLGYIARRPDLRREPHGWRIPRVVKVMVTVEAVAGRA